MSSKPRFEQDQNRAATGQDKEVQTSRDGTSVSPLKERSPDGRSPDGRSPNDMETAVTQLFANSDTWRLYSGDSPQERVALAASEQLFRGLYQLSPIPCFTTHASGQIADANFAAERLFGMTRDKLRGLPLRSLVLPGDRANLDHHISSVLAGRHESLDVTLEADAARSLPAALRSVSVTTPSSSDALVLTAILDLSQFRAVEQNLVRARDYLDHVAHHDALTGLPNRVLFTDRLRLALQRARRRSSKVAVLLLDLDHFKDVNDTLGHPAGDELLRQLSQRIQMVTRDEDTIARLGGDEFVVVLSDITNRSDVANVAEKLITAIAEPVVLSDQTVNPSASIGVSLFPDDALDGERLIKFADVAMYRTKERGRDGVCFFDAGMSAALEAKLDLERELHHAVGSGALSLRFQPQFSARDGRLCGFEALARWRHPRRGMLMPDAFIPIAEETRLINELGWWVTVEACEQHARWRALGLNVPRMAVNFSARQLLEPGLTRRIADLLHRCRMPPETFEIELTESALVSDVESVVRVFAELREMGVHIAIDDFGTGYSSLGRLRQLPISRLKIDRSFVQRVEHEPDDRAIAKAIISMAHDLNLSVVSEGVETFGQYKFLEQNGCDELQGFFLGHPETGERATQEIPRWRLGRMRPAPHGC